MHRTKVIYNYGYSWDPQAECSCGWYGPPRKFSWVATTDGRRHWKASAGWVTDPLNGGIQ